MFPTLEDNIWDIGRTAQVGRQATRPPTAQPSPAHALPPSNGTEACPCSANTHRGIIASVILRKW